MTSQWDRHTRPLLGAIVLASLPQLTRSPYWLIAAAAVYTAMVLAVTRHKGPSPARTVKWLLIVGGVAGIKLTYGHIVGRDPGMSLFMLMALLKILEIHTDRDRMVALCMAYFLLAANLFFHQSVVMAAHMIFSVWVTTAVMIHIQDPRSRWRRHLRTSGTLVLQALPVMVVLFFLFPRIQGSLWGVPKSDTGTTGFTSRLSLGDVTNIVQTNEVAFRAAFDQEPPPVTERYWRGIVFWSFDGVTWTRSRSGPPRGALPTRQQPSTYTITIEPSGARWMFALDLPDKAAPDTWMDADHTLRAIAPIVQRTSYQLTSFRRYRTLSATAWEIRRGLQLPEGSNPRTVALGRRLAAEHATPSAIVAAALDYMIRGGFTYTLNPPPPLSDPVDQFLFDTKKGYCEHFAAAFTLLMRAAGVPARVVGGYLGGEANPYSNYLIIRQSDAHAWVEVLSDDKGWQRIDPTALVAPNRVSRSLAEAVPQEELPAYLAFEGYGLAGEGLRALRLSWDAVNLNWHRWVASYSHRHQARLLSRVGISMETWRGAALSGLAAVLLTVIIVAAVVLRPQLRRRRTTDPAVKAYGTFLKKAARAGLPRKKSHDGPTEYGHRIAELRPDLAPRINAITRSYVRYRYGKTAAPEDLDRLRTHVRRFAPKSGTTAPDRR